MISAICVLLSVCRLQTSACVSPCGGLVLAGSEDSTVNVWNADTGEQLAIYSGLQFHQPASGVDYHPFEHMVAFSSYGSSACIVVCDYDKIDSGKDIGLQMLVQQDAALQSTTGDFTDSCLKSSTPFHSGLLSLREKKKLMSVNDSEVEIVQGLPLPGFSLSPNSTNIGSPWKENDSETNKERLASIIEKMDQVLSKTPKRSQQSSESFSTRFSDTSPSKTESMGYSTTRKKNERNSSECKLK